MGQKNSTATGKGKPTTGFSFFKTLEGSKVQMNSSFIGDLHLSFKEEHLIEGKEPKELIKEGKSILVKFSVRPSAITEKNCKTFRANGTKPGDIKVSHIKRLKLPKEENTK